MNQLTRDDFRNGIFARDDHKCVICRSTGQDAHHIIERRLWPDGGYYLDNGATLCAEHHIAAEQTTLSCEEIRKAAGIINTALPPHLYPDERWDKWGNMILPNNSRVKGELFYDESVQKILAAGNVLSLFVKWIKYPRTYHLPSSPGATEDDRILAGTSHFAGKRVIITEKRDGENTTLYRDYVHARSVTPDNHPSKNWVKGFQPQIGWNIPDGWRLCGENLWVEHSIHYNDLSSYFEAFSVWNDLNVCLSWDDSLEWFELIGVAHVPVLYDGIWDDGLVDEFIPADTSRREGFVVRIADSFHYAQFRNSVAKWVRPNHVQTAHGWKRKKLVHNELGQ